MNTSYPHEIVNDLKEVPKAQSHSFRQLEPNQAELLRAMTPEQRGEWLQTHPLDAERVARADWLGSSRNPEGGQVTDLPSKARLEQVAELVKRPELGVAAIVDMNDDELLSLRDAALTLRRLEEHDAVEIARTVKLEWHASAYDGSTCIAEKRNPDLLTALQAALDAAEAARGGAREDAR